MHPESSRQSVESRFSRRSVAAQGGFTLVMTLILLAVVVMLVVGMFSSTTLESRITRNYDSNVQAGIAVESGFARATQLLRAATWSESNVIFCAEPAASASTGTNPPDPTLVSAVPLLVDGEVRWTYQALASGQTAVPDETIADTQQLRRVTVKPTEPEGSNLQAAGLPKTYYWKRVPTTYWETVQSDGEPDVTQPKVRYCFWVEDMQGCVDLGTAGNFGPATDPMDPRYGGLLVARSYKHSRERPVVRASLNDYTAAPSEWYTGLVPGLRTPDDNPLSMDRLCCLNQSALYSLINPAAIVDNETLDNELAIARRYPVSDTERVNLLYAPEVWKAWLAGKALPEEYFTRYTEKNAPHPSEVGRIANSATRALEENTILGVRPYTEMPVIPPYPAPAFAGVLEPKLNLNRVLMQIEREDIKAGGAQTWDTSPLTGVDLIAKHIDSHLPSFKDRVKDPEPSNKIGFSRGSSNAEKQRNYLRNLAASMIDYADTDCLPTIDQIGNQYANWGRYYRGCDSYPVVSEQFMKVKWEDVYNAGTPTSKKRVKLSVTFFYELWNMSNRPVEAEFQAAYMTNTPVKAGSANFNLDVAGVPSNPADALKGYTFTNRPTKDGGLYWMQLYLPRTDGKEDLPNGTIDKSLSKVTLPANGYTVLANAPVVIDNIDAGLTSSFIPQIELSEDITSRYCLRMKATAKAQVPEKLFGSKGTSVSTASDWTLIDQPRGTLERYPRNLTYGDDLTKRQKFNGTLPGMSYALKNSDFADNVGDPRAAFYINYFQDVVNYAEGASPWGQNFRRNIFIKKPLEMYSRNRITRWPDFGHNCGPGLNGLDPYGDDVAWGITINPKDDALSDHISPHHSTILARRDALLAAEPSGDPLTWDKRAPMRISNARRFFSTTELGNIFDPIMWDPDGDPVDSNLTWAAHADVGTAAKASDRFCGGNTLRIGRMDHSRFRPACDEVIGTTDNAIRTDGTVVGPLRGMQPDRRMAATALLDLFHCGIPMVGRVDTASGDTEPLENLRDLTGPLIEIRGHININTASRDALRTLIAGELTSDPVYSESATAGTVTSARPPRSEAGGTVVEAALIADRIIQSREDRPFLSTAELSERVVAGSKKPDGTVNTHIKAVLGDRSDYVVPAASSLPSSMTSFEWTDALAEEVFARLYNGSTVRSRNFRVFVTGQALKSRRSDPTRFDVVATKSRVFHVFVKPVRDPETGLLVDQKIEITYERDL